MSASRKLVSSLGSQFPDRRHATKRSTRGSAGLDTLLAFAVLATGLYLACSLGGRLRQHVALDRFVTEIKALSVALENYHRDFGRWPAAASEGESPEGLARYLADGKWPTATPLGGRYVWTPGAAGIPATLGITAFKPDAPLAISRAELRTIDAILDDGNLTTGRFRTAFNDWPIWLVTP